MKASLERARGRVVDAEKTAKLAKEGERGAFAPSEDGGEVAF